MPSSFSFVFSVTTTPFSPFLFLANIATEPPSLSPSLIMSPSALTKPPSPSFVSKFFEA